MIRLSLILILITSFDVLQLVIDYNSATFVTIIVFTSYEETFSLLFAAWNFPASWRDIFVFRVYDEECKILRLGEIVTDVQMRPHLLRS